MNPNEDLKPYGRLQFGANPSVRSLPAESKVYRTQKEKEELVEEWLQLHSKKDNE